MDSHLIILHGFFRSKYCMLPLELYFKSRGYRTHNYWYSSYRYDYEQAALRLISKIKQDIPEGSELNFIGHSMGCLITRVLANHLKDTYRINRAVMLGPPNKGAALAEKLSQVKLLNLLMGPNLKKLAKCEIEDRHNLEIGVIAGGTSKETGIIPIHNEDNDGIVRVSETQLPGLKDFYLHKMGHSFFMFDPRVYKLSESFFKTGCFK